MARILRLVLAGLGGALYAWFAGVRNAPAVKRRKAARRGVSGTRRPTPRG